MRYLLTLAALSLISGLSAQTAVNNSSFTFPSGVRPTFSVVFTKADAAQVEKWYKDQLKAISSDIGGKKEIIGIGTRLPEVSSDTIRVFLKADQPKKSEDVTLQAAFLVNGTFVGPDSEQRQVEGCRSWMYQRAVMLKKELAQKDLDAANKQLALLQTEQTGLVKEKDRAQSTIEKTQAAIVKDEQEKVAVEGESTALVTRVQAKQQEVGANASEENTKELQALLKEQQKLKSKGEKLTERIADNKKKVEDLQFAIKKNLGEQDAKNKMIEVQKKAVEELTAKLAGIN
jgi:SMC interacting uncharacterized protein involved in chromosome segregation